MIAPWLLNEVSKKPGEKWILAAPTFGILTAATLPTFFHQVADTSAAGNWNKGSMTYELPDGGIIYFRSLHDPESIQGIVASGAAVDECGLISEDAWRTVQQRTSYKQGRILGCSTPYYPSGWYADCVNDAKINPNSDYDYFSWPSTANPTFPPEEFERARRELPPSLFAMRYLGEFGRPEGQVYSVFDDANIVEHSYNPAVPLIVGCDFNVNPMAWVIAQSINGELHIIDEIALKYDARTIDALDELHRRYANHKGKLLFIGDASSKSRKTSAAITDYQQIEQDKRFLAMGRQINFPNANPNVVDRVNCVNGLMLNANGQRRLFVNRGCKQLLEDLRMVRYISGSRVIDKRVYDGHFADALGYICWSLFPIRPINIGSTVISTRTFQ